MLTAKGPRTDVSNVNTYTYHANNATCAGTSTDRLRGADRHDPQRAMGNRTAEAVKDAGGTIRRNITRVYNELNRLRSITGGLQ